MIARQLIAPLKSSVTHAYRAPYQSRLAGGDVVCVVDRFESGVTMLLADVSAKGTEGDAFASWLAAVFRSYVGHVAGPAMMLGQLNRAMYRVFADPTRGLFATAFVCQYLPAQEYILYSNAGGPPALLVHDECCARYLEANGMVLGVDKDARFRQSAVPVGSGDTLIAYTDGVTDGECRALSRAEVAGASTGHDILCAIDQFNGGIYRDDATVLAARFDYP